MRTGKEGKLTVIIERAGRERLFDADKVRVFDPRPCFDAAKGGLRVQTILWESQNQSQCEHQRPRRSMQRTLNALEDVGEAVRGVHGLVRAAVPVSKLAPFADDGLEWDEGMVSL